MTHAPATLTDSVFPVFSQYIEEGDTLIVGASGGPDSTALVELLVEFTQKTSCRIIVAHVNHRLRGKAAERDEEFVKKMAVFFDNNQGAGG